HLRQRLAALLPRLLARLRPRCRPKSLAQFPAERPSAYRAHFSAPWVLGRSRERKASSAGTASWASWGCPNPLHRSMKSAAGSARPAVEETKLAEETARAAAGNRTRAARRRSLRQRPALRLRPKPLPEPTAHAAAAGDPESTASALRTVTAEPSEPRARGSAGGGAISRYRADEPRRPTASVQR